jgi:hypothetical protein
VVILISKRITSSISWSYHTVARDVFVGFLFVIAAFLFSYRGRKPTLDPSEVGKFWIWVSKFWKGAIAFRIWERRHEEDVVSVIGGVGALVTAICPTAYSVKSPPGDLPARCLTVFGIESHPDGLISTFHFIGAAFLFATTVYFCLVAFRASAKAKRIAEGRSGGGTDPKNLRIIFYSICGWGIAVIMVVSIVVVKAGLGATSNLIFWAEAAALELFGIGWLVASQKLPVFTDKAERQQLSRSTYTAE